MPTPTPITVKEYEKRLNRYKREATRLFRAADDRTKGTLWVMTQLDIVQTSLSGYFFDSCPIGREPRPIMSECGDGSCAPPGECGGGDPPPFPPITITLDDYRQRLDIYKSHAMNLFRSADVRTRALLGGLTHTNTQRIGLFDPRD